MKNSMSQETNKNGLKTTNNQENTQDAGLPQNTPQSTIPLHGMNDGNIIDSLSDSILESFTAHITTQHLPTIQTAQIIIIAVFSTDGVKIEVWYSILNDSIDEDNTYKIAIGYVLN